MKVGKFYQKLSKTAWVLFTSGRVDCINLWYHHHHHHHHHHHPRRPIQASHPFAWFDFSWKITFHQTSSNNFSKLFVLLVNIFFLCLCSTPQLSSHVLSSISRIHGFLCGKMNPATLCTHHSQLIVPVPPSCRRRWRQCCHKWSHWPRVISKCISARRSCAFVYTSCSVCVFLASCLKLRSNVGSICPFTFFFSLSFDLVSRDFDWPWMTCRGQFPWSGTTLATLLPLILWRILIDLILWIDNTWTWWWHHQLAPVEKKPVIFFPLASTSRFSDVLSYLCIHESKHFIQFCNRSRHQADWYNSGLWQDVKPDGSFGKFDAEIPELLAEAGFAQLSSW